MKMFGKILLGVSVVAIGAAIWLPAFLWQLILTGVLLLIVAAAILGQTQSKANVSK